MRQSTVIFGTLLLAFIVYITVRGQLPAYLALFSAKEGGSTTASNSQTASGNSVADSAAAFQGKIEGLLGNLLQGGGL